MVIDLVCERVVHFTKRLGAIPDHQPRKEGEAMVIDLARESFAEYVDVTRIPGFPDINIHPDTNKEIWVRMKLYGPFEEGKVFTLLPFYQDEEIYILKEEGMISFDRRLLLGEEYVLPPGKRVFFIKV